ncbi:hypothetical protein BCR32DRAFT_279566 [Anaeromyces robustus]|uniref:Uncharacterized protein n=1 Tax=Anaeromyces robustus TaxID=1754192 RepID=A0A1Y1X797_9FUNG|nr:hypothetical protein BCR32DRAFT_279566 [Anaeromyces robustus]|eukprot:ORX81650.1 hypothetical protein BCR32DRAFT_279566 [Anaeromyces robustus]
MKTFSYMDLGKKYIYQIYTIWIEKKSILNCCTYHKENLDFNKIADNCPYNKEWKCLFKCQTVSGTDSKSPFLLRSAGLY